MADYIRRTADPFLDDLDAETKEMMIGALEIACESREFETDEVEDIFVGSGCSSEVAQRRCGELRRALGYGGAGDAGDAGDDGDAADDGGVDYEDQRPLAVYAFVALVVVGVVAWLLRLEEGEGIRLICEHYHTCLMGVVLIPVFHSLRGQKLALDGHDSDSD